MKVVINSCFGGFGLSDAAFEDLLTRKGVAWEKVKDKYDFDAHYEAGHAGDEDYYLSYREYTENRADPDLVAVVEQFGNDVNTSYSELKIVDVPDDVEWFIVEYDGLEHVAEEHRTWS
jgi:hypothetical protein